MSARHRAASKWDVSRAPTGMIPAASPRVPARPGWQRVVVRISALITVGLVIIALAALRYSAPSRQEDSAAASGSDDAIPPAPVALARESHIRALINRVWLSYPAPAAERAAEPKETEEPGMDLDAAVGSADLFRRAEELVAGGDHGLAIEKYLESLRLRPKNFRAWVRLARCYLRIQDYARARIALEHALELDPFDVSVLNDLGVINFYQNDIAQALKLFSMVQDLDPSDTRSIFNRALCLLAQDSPREARAALKRYLRSNPRDVMAMKEKAYLDADSGEFDEALETLRRALEMEPEWAPLYFDAAAAAALIWHVDDALAYLAKAEELTSAAAAARVYQEPAFLGVRLTEAGKKREQDLAERNRFSYAHGRPAEVAEILIEPLMTETTNL